MVFDELQHVVRKSTESIVADTLRDYILSGAVPPGCRLTEVALAEQLGVARATLRTALHRLTAEGLVVQIPYTGWHVAALTAQDVWEIWTLRGSLESLAARLAAARQEPEGRVLLEQAHAALLAACAGGDLHDMIETDVALHRTIVEVASHQRLLAQYTIVERQVQLYIATSNAHVATGPEDIVEQHRPLVAALLAGDSQRAAREAWRHNEREGRRLTAWLERHDRAREPETSSERV